MTWADILRHPASRVLRQFSAAWLVFFLATALLQGLVRGHPGTAALLAILGLGVGGLGLVRPQAVRALFVGCMLLAFPVGWLVSQVMLLVMFYGIITPVALFFRLRGRDLLRRKPPGPGQTLWTEKKTPADLRRYFRQY